MKDKLTRCDTCDELYECIKKNKVQDVTIRTDIMRHYIPNYDYKCDKFCRQESEEKNEQ